jgi:hypothetical protein
MTSARARLSPIIELRRYTLHPGTRETLICLFDAHFVEGQEALGMSIIGQFRDLDDDNAFVWLRGFPDMEARRQALTSFYSGPVWLANRDAANATMLTFNDVHLLEPAEPGGGFAVDLASRPALDAPGEAFTRIGGLVTANVIGVKGDAGAFAAWHRKNMLPVLEKAGANVLATFVTNHSVNTYPALPVHADRKVLVVFTRFPDRDSFDRFRATLAASKEWAAASKEAAAYVSGPPRTLRLDPTGRSALR